MFHLLYKYFALHHQLTIPGIGGFVLEREHAKVDAVQSVIHPPLQVVKFKPHAAQLDNSFYVYLADELQIEVLEAIRRYQNFASDLKQEVQDKKWVELPNIGILTPGVRDEIKFKSVPVLREYYPATAAENVSTVTTHTPLVEAVEEQEPVTVTAEDEKVFDVTYRKQKDYWWVFAILLTLVGVGAIAYYYYYHGSLLY